MTCMYDLCDTGYVGYTGQHLEEHKKSANGNRTRESTTEGRRIVPRKGSQC